VELRELDTLLRELLPDSRKPGLAAAAEELGIPVAGRGSPLVEADVVTRVVERIRQRQAASPGRAGLCEPAGVTGDSGPLPFTHAWLADVPGTPGVYVMADADGKTLYVGKAVDLRRRLSDYVSKQPSLHRRFEALGVRAATVQTIVTASDLEATLLEARLIREHQPSFNTARSTRGPATIVRAAPDDPSPRVQVVGEARSDGARYFGPFESTTAARQAVAVARAAYPAAFERRRGDVDAQRGAVLAVCRLLAGQREPTVEALRLAMRDAAAAGDRPEVDRLRSTLRAVQTLEVRPSFLVGLPAGWRLLVLEWLYEDGPRRLHLIEDGRLVASTDTDATALPCQPRLMSLFAEGAFGPLDAIAGASEPWTPGDTSIVLRWLVQARQRIDVARLPSHISNDE
jgi:predicted GIY-YIG superfamily endonuclease